MHRPENKLLRQLPQAARQQLLGHCELCELSLSTELSVRGQPLRHAYFPTEGFLSLVIDVDSHPALEVGMLGAESMLGSELVLGLAATPWRALVQGAGAGWRIGTNDQPKASRSFSKAHSPFQARSVYPFSLSGQTYNIIKFQSDN